MKQRKNQQGVAMVVVMVTMLCVTALCLALLLTASVMMMNAVRTNQKEQCRITAVSVSQALVEQVKGYSYHGAPSSQADKESSLDKKLQTVATAQWYAYDKDASTVEQIQTRGKDYFTYELTDSQLPGKTVLELYWIDESGELNNLTPEQIEERSESFQSLVLYAKVTNTTGRESSTIINKFMPVVETDWSWKWVYMGREWERSDS